MISSEEKDRVRHGLQCPECSGVHTDKCRRDVTGRVVTDSWFCRECGCHWDKQYYPSSE